MMATTRDQYGRYCDGGWEEGGWVEWNGYASGYQEEQEQEQEQSWDDNTPTEEEYEGYPVDDPGNGGAGQWYQCEDFRGWSYSHPYPYTPYTGPFIQDSPSNEPPTNFQVPLRSSRKEEAFNDSNPFHGGPSSRREDCLSSPRQSLIFPSDEPVGSLLPCNCDQYKITDETLKIPQQKSPQRTNTNNSPPNPSKSNPPKSFPKLTFFHSHQTPKNESISRKQFKETIGMAFYHDLESGSYSYDEIINKYSKMYPQFAHKFTRDFCSKVRCGRIMKLSPQSEKTRVKRIVKLSQRRKWKKLTTKLFYVIYDWEKSQNQPIKQSDVEERFNVNRSTYYRWKKNYESNGNPQP
eukprot:TRINITY_DN20846_c0_g2_i3.p1 TRINITY_DN20846_c0_g2~~TRINITY_DN20846_c0_g2_i3.p1  ORF type:complete len:350 (+),score=90.96 TRINITY_DN20846_c0_g2_i3:69-1118(+)